MSQHITYICHNILYLYIHKEFYMKKIKATSSGIKKTTLKSSERHFYLTHALHDLSHCLAPGLFRSLSKGERKKQKLEVIYHYGKDSITFLGPEPLGCDDLRVLQGLIALAAISGPNGAQSILGPEPKTEIGIHLRKFLELKGDAIHMDAIIAKINYKEFAHELGYNTKRESNFRIIRKCVRRLWTISIIIKHNGREQGYRLLSDYSSNSKDEKILVALNPRLAEAVMGKRNHNRINLSESRVLKTDAACLLHQRLCAWIDQGRSGKVEIDTLCSYVWPNECKPDSMKKRRQRIREALEELEKIGWTSVKYKEDSFEIFRPKIKLKSSE